MDTTMRPLFLHQTDLARGRPGRCGLLQMAQRQINAGVV